MEKTEDDIATLEREIAVLNEREAIERATPAMLVALARARAERDSADNRAAVARGQHEHIECLLSDTLRLRKAIPVIAHDRRMSLRRLELGSQAQHSSQLLSLHRHDVGTKAIESWADNYDARMAGLKSNSAQYASMMTEAQSEADRYRTEATRLEKEYATATKTTTASRP